MKKIILSLSLLFLSMQALATLNPNPVTNEIHWSADGTSGELRWTSYLDAIDFGIFIEGKNIMRCFSGISPSSTAKEGAEFVTTWSGCLAVPDFANFAGASVAIEYDYVSIIGNNVTLCLDGDCLM